MCNDNNIIIDYVNLNNHLIKHAGNRLGIVDKLIQLLRQKIQVYFDEYDTNKYIDVLDKLVENINNSYNSGIKSVPNTANPLDIELEMTEKYIDAVLSDNNKLKIGDNVRAIANKNLFNNKGSLPIWTRKIYTIMEVKAHSYLLDNNKWFKYYHLQKVKLTDDDNKQRLNERESLRKTNTIKRKLNKECGDCKEKGGKTNYQCDCQKQES